MPRLRQFCIGLIALGTVAETARLLADTATGPSSSASPYIINVPANVEITSILTVGDTVSDKPDDITPYRMVGIPDGLGAYDNNDGTFTVLMNHELGVGNGVEREHGFSGAFVSQWIIRKSDLAVLHGGDLIKKLIEWDGANFVRASKPIGRLCSADLPLPSALYNRQSGKGYSGRIFMDGEEVGSEGRAFAHIVSGPGAGISYQLASLGKFSWENAVASPYEQDKTIVIGMDDSTPGQVYVYIGEKRAAGTEIEKAGLEGGKLYGVRVVVGGESQEFEIRETWVGTNEARFELQDVGFRENGEPVNVRALTGTQIQSSSVAHLVTEFLRPEDGAWDTRNPKVFYFVTTDRYDTVKDGSGGTQVGRSRLHRLTFDDIGEPEKGGSYDVLLDGTGPYQMLDNMTVDVDGNLILQEDPGGQHHLARIWKFFPRNGALIEIAKHDPARFGDRDGQNETAPTAPFTIDEESSGVVDITHLLRKNQQGSDWDRVEGTDNDELHEKLKWAKRGYRYYLAVTQAHYSPDDPELVEGGQLYLIGVPKGVR
jgi:hypothetical protein